MNLHDAHAGKPARQRWYEGAGNLPRKASESSDGDISLMDLIRRHWLLILLILASSMLIGGLVTRLLPRQYRAEAKFLVRDGRDNFVMTTNQAAIAGERPNLTEEQVNSEIELLQSHDLLVQVALRDGFYRGSMRNGTPADPAALDRAVNTLARSLEVAVVRKTNILLVRLNARTPDSAAAALRHLTTLYLAANIQAHGSPTSVGFFEDQAAAYRERSTAAQTQLLHFRDTTNTYDEDQQRSALVAQAESVQARLDDNSAQIAQQRTRLSNIRMQTAHVSERRATSVKTSVNQLLLDRLEGQQADLENRRIELLVKFRLEDRVVTAVDAEIANTKRQIAAARTTTSEEHSTDVNPLHEALLSQMSDAEIALNGLLGLRTGLLHQLNDTQERLQQLGRNAVELRNLEDAQKQAEDTYVAYQRRTDEARLAEAMDQKKIANVAVIQAASASALPVSPNLKLNLLISAFLGMLLGLGIAFLLESTSAARQRSAAHRAERSAMSEHLIAMAVAK